MFRIVIRISLWIAYLYCVKIIPNICFSKVFLYFSETVTNRDINMFCMDRKEICLKIRDDSNNRNRKEYDNKILINVT
jgi:hypothetical protein